MVKLRKSQRAIKEGAGYTFKWTTHKDDGIGKETGIGTRPRPRPRRPFADVISTEQWDTTLRTQCVSSSSSSSSFYQVPPQQQFHSSLPFTGNTPTEWTKLFFFFFKEKGGNDGSARLGSFFTPSEKERHRFGDTWWLYHSRILCRVYSTARWTWAPIMNRRAVRGRQCTHYNSLWCGVYNPHWAAFIFCISLLSFFLAASWRSRRVEEKRYKIILYSSRLILFQSASVGQTFDMSIWHFSALKLEKKGILRRNQWING